MTDAPVVFNDAELYENFMGPWSRSVGTAFLDWVASSMGRHWLDVGCGTGAFTQLVLGTCAPASVIAVDPSGEQIGYARKQAMGQQADFRVANAETLPFPDGSFDIVTSALVINFIPDRARALIEMRRVTRPNGTVAAYVWDFASGHGVSWPLVRGMQTIGIEAPHVPGTEDSSIKALQSLFERAGYEEIGVQAIKVTRTFANFDEYWTSQTPPFSPNGKVIAALSEADRADMADAVHRMLPVGADGTITYEVCANAVKGLVPA